MKLLHYVFLVIAALGALSFSVECSGISKRADTSQDLAQKKPADDLLERLKAQSPFFIYSFQRLNNYDPKKNTLEALKKLEILIERVEEKRKEVELLVKDNSDFKKILGEMNGDNWSAVANLLASAHWAKFLRLDVTTSKDKKARLAEVLERLKQVKPFTLADFSKLSSEEQQGFDAKQQADRDQLVSDLYENFSLYIPKPEEAPQAPKTEDKKESKSIIPQFVRNNPLYFGLGSGVAVLALLVAKIKIDYDKNPPVDESGEIISFKKHVLSELASFDYTKMNFWIKTTALGLAGAGIYGSWVNAQAA